MLNVLLYIFELVVFGMPTAYCLDDGWNGWTGLEWKRHPVFLFLIFSSPCRIPRGEGDLGILSTVFA